MPVFVSPQSVAGALFEAKAVGFNFGKVIRFKSGILSPGAYNNNRLLPSHPTQWSKIINVMSAVVNDFKNDFTVVASVATGGIAHGVALARVLKLPHFIVKKEEKTSHGIGGMIDGDTTLLLGARVLMVEDMSSTFESTLKAIPKIEFYGAKVTRTLAISTWGFPEFTKNVGDHNVHVLCTGNQFLEHGRRTLLLNLRYHTLLESWLENPHDDAWVDEKWSMPAEK